MRDLVMLRQPQLMVLVLVLAFPLLAGLNAPQRAVAAAQDATHTQGNPISIPETTTPSRAAPYGIALTVPTVFDTIVDAKVTVRKLNHTAAADLDILVTSPSNRAVLLMSDVGSLNDLVDTSITFNDAATRSLPSDGSAITTGSYKPTNHTAGDVMPSPAPGPSAKGYATRLSFFDGTNPSGVWKLWIVDDFMTTFSGTLGQGWSLTLTVSSNGTLRTITQSVNTSAKILNATIANPFPSTLNVEGESGVVDALRVTLHGVSHTAPSNLDVLLVGPSGQAVVLMSDTGGSADINSVGLTFRDDTSGSLPPSSTIVSGDYRPTNLDGSTNDVFPFGVPPGSVATALAAFNGTDPNGVWQLFVADDNASHDAGSMASWSLTIGTNSPPVIAEMPNVITDSGRTKDVPIPVTDLDGDLLSFSASTLPGYATIVLRIVPGGQAAMLRLQPGPDDIGTSFDATIRVSDGSLSDSETLTIAVVEDNDAPGIFTQVNSIASDAGWHNSPLEILVRGSDGSGIESIRVQTSGATTTDFGVDPGDEFVFAIDAEGITTIFVTVTDNVGNRSFMDFLLPIDLTPPTVTQPTQRFKLGAQLGSSTVPVQVTWSGADTPSGLQRFELRELIDRNGDVPALPLPNPLATTLSRQLAPGHSYTHCIDAVDNADNLTVLFECSEHTRLARVQESNGSIAYSAGWTASSGKQFFGGAVRAATATDATATYTFSGRSIAWVSTVGTGRGIAEVTVDGGAPVLVDLFASVQTTRRIVFARNNLNNGQHTITVRVTGDKNPAAVGRRVDIDAFATLFIEEM